MFRKDKERSSIELENKFQKVLFELDRLSNENIELKAEKLEIVKLLQDIENKK
jgi:hypothetical protein